MRERERRRRGKEEGVEFFFECKRARDPPSDLLCLSLPREERIGKEKKT